MRPGGALLLSEKIVFTNPAEQERMEALHLAFKKANGYSDLEISQKRSALENVLIPDTLAQHQARLQAAGFNSVDMWFRCINFVSLLAIK
jgi:tRNA (cmo5U34)-methyltransferase